MCLEVTLTLGLELVQLLEPLGLISKSVLTKRIALVNNALLEVEGPEVQRLGVQVEGDVAGLQALRDLLCHDKCDVVAVRRPEKILLQRPGRLDLGELLEDSWGSAHLLGELLVQLCERLGTLVQRHLVEVTQLEV